jgi:hypothetical protein
MYLCLENIINSMYIQWLSELIILLLWREHPLLGNYLETNNETTFAARQRIRNKQVYSALLGNAFAKEHVPTEKLSTTMNGVFYAVRAEIL